MTTERRISRRSPSAKRLIDALRDTGYSFETAIADLVDNSIAALATNIDIQAYLDQDGTQIVYIADNGHGMNEAVIEDAMTYGSEERDESRSLGKFGLGMKTASTSQARSFTVVTKTVNDGVHSATWDLDHVVKEDEWELLWDYPNQEELEDIIDSLPPNTLNLAPITINPEESELENIRYRCHHCEFGEEGESPLIEVEEHISSAHGTPEGSGTIVLWEKIDRVIKQYANPNGDHARTAWDSKVESLREHLGMVFERYISDGYPQVRTLNISLNGTPLIPWDPFCKDHDSTREIMNHSFKVQDVDEKLIGHIHMTAYTVPHSAQFSDTDEKNAAKMNEANKWQGIYVYREQRMLVAHDWFKLRARESHCNCLRIELSFDYRLDEALQLDFKKTRVIFDPAIREAIRDHWLPNVAREAGRIYRERGAAPGGDDAEDIHEESDVLIDGVDVTGLTVEVPEDTEDGTAIADVENPEGRHQVTITVASTERGNTRVQPVESIQGNMIYQPAWIDGDKGVQLNRGHEFYQKVYLPNKHLRSVTLGLDGLFWALSMAELKAIPASASARWFEDLRWELTRIMDDYATQLPEDEEAEA
jgi:hypothetical protein